MLGPWIGIIAFIISLYILWQVRQLLLLLFTAVVLATALNIVVERLQRSKLKRGYAVLLSISLLFATGVLFVGLIVPPFIDQLQSLKDLVPLGIERSSLWFSTMEERLSPQFIRALPDVDWSRQLSLLFQQLVGGGLAIFSVSLEILISFLLVLVLTLMLLGNPAPYRRGFIRLFPSFYRHRVDVILQQCQEALQGWLLGILFNMLVITVLSFVGLVALDIPLALSQAMVAGILTFIPNVGPTLSVIPPIAIALLDELWKVPAVLVLYVIIQQLESSLLTPVVMQKQVSLLPAVTLVAQVFFASFFGFLGLFVALPLTVVGQIWIQEVLISDILDPWHQAKVPVAEPSVPAQTSAIASPELPDQPS